MTLAAIGLVAYPTRLLRAGAIGSTLTRQNLTFDSTTDRVAFIGSMPVADTLDKVYFRTGTVTTGTTVEVRIESLSNGRPSGSLIAAGASVTVEIADANDNAWKTAAIGTPPTLAAGAEFAVVIKYSSGSTPNLQFTAAEAELHGLYGHSPACLQDTGAGTWANAAGQWNWIIEGGSSGVLHLPGLLPADGSGTLQAFNSGSSPDEYALKFVAPFKARCVGLSAALFNIAAGADFTLSLWPASSSVDGDALGQAARDGDLALSTTQDGYVSAFFAPVTLVAGTTYYAGIRADTANNLSAGLLPAPSGITNAMRGFPLGANTAHLSTRAWSAGSAGAWTDTTTTLPLISLLLDQLDDGAGGGRAQFLIGGM